MSWFKVCKTSNLPARTCKKLLVASFCASETAETGRIANGCEQGDHVSRRKGAIERAACCPDRGKLPAYQKVPERERIYSFCFCKKNQKAAGTPSCDLGSNRRSIHYFGLKFWFSSGNRLCTNHYFAQYRRQWFEPLRTPSVAKKDMQLCTNSKRILLMTVGYDVHLRGSYGVVGMGYLFR